MEDESDKIKIYKYKNIDESELITCAVLEVAWKERYMCNSGKFLEDKCEERYQIFAIPSVCFEFPFVMSPQ